MTEAIGSYYDEEPSSPQSTEEPRPLSFVPASQDVFATSHHKKSKRNGSYFDANQARMNLSRADSNEKVPRALDTANGSTYVKRMSGLGTENGATQSPTSPPRLSRQSSSDTAVQQFPLNDIDYESSPAAVAQELSNLQAIRRMSMNVDAADPDLPSFGGGLGVPTVPPDLLSDDNDAARLFWVPARLHPELAPKEFKTFIEDRVDKIRRRSGDSDILSVDSLERSGSGTSLRRKKSMLSHQIDTKGSYEDGADRLERKRSRGMSREAHSPVDLQELESLVSDPNQVMRRISSEATRKSFEAGSDVSDSADRPIVPPGGPSLKRSTRTTYRRGSLRKGERVPFSKRAQQRQTESETDEPLAASPTGISTDESILGLTRVQTEPSPSPTSTRQFFPSRTDASLRKRNVHAEPQDVVQAVNEMPQDTKDEVVPPVETQNASQPGPRQQPKQFQSRLAISGGRTTAQLPGYNNTNPLPNIIETLPDGSTVPSQKLMQSIQVMPERKSSHEFTRPFQRGGAHSRPVPGRDHQRSSTLDDISSRPSPLPGSGNTSTDALTMVPTFDDRKPQKKDPTRKSSWKWILGSDGDDVEKKDRAKEEKASDVSSVKSSKTSRLLNKSSTNDKTRLDVLQTSIDGNQPSRGREGRESLVLNREDLKLDEERKKEGKKAAEPKRDKEKDSGLLSAIFGGKKKASDGDLKEKKRKADRGLSPDPSPRVLKPDIDYNWTRFSILEERAIYRMAHIKLANPRRALYSQVLLSNFMYSYLAKVQMMHPQVHIPPAHQKNLQRGKSEQQQQQQQQPAEYSQYQRWQRVSMPYT